jgi:hypothetical protein
MPHHRPGCGACAHVPAGAGEVGAPAGFETQPGLGHENVALAGIHGDSFAKALLAVLEIAARWQRAAHQTSFAQDVGNGSGTTVAAVVVRGVAAAPFVGFALEAVAGGERAFHRHRSIARSGGDAVSQQRSAAVLEAVADRLAGWKTQSSKANVNPNIPTPFILTDRPEDR